MCVSLSGEDRTKNQRKRPMQWRIASSDVLARPRARSPSVHVDTLKPLRMLATARHAAAECWPMQAWHQVALAERLHLDQNHWILRKFCALRARGSSDALACGCASTRARRSFRAPARHVWLARTRRVVGKRVCLCTWGGPASMHAAWDRVGPL